MTLQDRLKIIVGNYFSTTTPAGQISYSWTHDTKRFDEISIFSLSPEDETVNVSQVAATTSTLSRYTITSS